MALPAAARAPAAILVRTPNWLGDLMMATAFLEALCARFPDVPIDLIVRRGLENIPLPHRGRVLAFDRTQQSAGAFGRGLRGQGYSHCFVLPPSFSAAWMAWRSRIPWRIGYGGEGRGLLLRPALRRTAAPRSRHLALEYLDLLRPWGVQSDGATALHLPVDAAWVAQRRPAALAGLDGYVVLASGAEYGPAKQWPLAYYARLAQGLGAAGWPVVVAGLAKDRAAAEQILQGVPGGINLCGDTGLEALIAVLAGAALLASNDSGAMHIGAALGIAQVAFFGSTNPRWTAPLNPRAHVLTRSLPCAPCYARECPLGHLNCLRELTPEPVLAQCLDLLGARSA
jgi:heptosyltransferase-2